MTKKREIDPAYYENTDFGDEFYDGEKKGDVVWTQPGESALDAIDRYMETKKKINVTMRIPKGIVDEAKGRAANAGVPWTSYICAVLEHTFAKQQTHTASL